MTLTGSVFSLVANFPPGTSAHNNDRHLDRLEMLKLTFIDRFSLYFMVFFLFSIVNVCTLIGNFFIPLQTDTKLSLTGENSTESALFIHFSTLEES